MGTGTVYQGGGEWRLCFVDLPVASAWIVTQEVSLDILQSVSNSVTMAPDDTTRHRSWTSRCYYLELHAQMPAAAC